MEYIFLEFHIILAFCSEKNGAGKLSSQWEPGVCRLYTVECESPGVKIIFIMTDKSYYLRWKRPKMLAHSRAS